MSDEVDDVSPPPPASSELAQFLWRHSRTGEPSVAELARLRPLVTGEPTDADLARVRQQVVRGSEASDKPTSPRRSFLPPELLAVAAVILVAVLGQLIYVATRPTPATPPQLGSSAAVMAAYRAGDLAEAKRLAGSSCTDANCASMSAKLPRAMDLSARLDSLDATELEELAQLDVALSGGVATELTEAIAKRRVNKGNAAPVVAQEKPDADAIYAEARALERESKPDQALSMLEKCLKVSPQHADCLALRAKLAPSAEQLFDEANAFRKERKLESAAIRAETCIKLYPLHHPCLRLLGSVYAQIATRDQSATDMEKAKKYYQRFLEVAPADDEYVPKIKAILNAAEDAENGTPAPQPPVSQAELMPRLYDLGLRTKRGSPVEASRYFRMVAESRDSSPELAAKAKEELAALRLDSREVYLRGYQLKESDPEEAARLFQQVVAMTPADDETHQKAKSRLADLGASVPAPEPALTPAQQKNIERAKELLVQLRGDPGPSFAETMKIYRQVLELTPAGHELHSLAERRLAAADSEPAPANESTLDLRLGQRVTITVPRLQRIAIGDPSIIDVRTLGNDQVLVIGAGHGKTTLLMWRSDGTRDSRLVTVK